MCAGYVWRALALPLGGLLHCLSDPASDCYLWLRSYSPWPLTLLMRAGGALALLLGFGPACCPGDGGYFTAHFYLHSPFTSPFIPCHITRHLSYLFLPSRLFPSHPYLLTSPRSSPLTSLFTLPHTPPFMSPFSSPFTSPSCHHFVTFHVTSHVTLLATLYVTLDHVTITATSHTVTLYVTF
jgi:hypothetical protein